MIWDLFVVICSLKKTELLGACFYNDLTHTRVNQTSSKLATSQMWEKLSGVDLWREVMRLEIKATKMLLNPNNFIYLL